MVPVGELPPDGVVLAGVVAPPEGEVAPLDGAEDPLVVVPVPVVEVVEVVALVVAATTAAAVGTVNGGTPAVSAVPVPPPPQAARPSPMATESTIAERDLGLRAPG